MNHSRIVFLLAVLLSLLFVGCGSEDADISAALKDLESDVTETRLKGIDALRHNRSDESIDALIKALEDPDPRVQHMAILYLEEIGLPAVSELAARYYELKTIPILQKDLDSPAYIQPEMEQWAELETEKAVMVFFPEVIASLADDPRATLIATHHGEAGDNPLYVVEHDGEKIAVFHPGVGAALAAMRLENLIVAGARKIVAVGGAGVVNGVVKFGDVVVIEEALRDEGASYHYLPPRRRVFPNPELQNLLVETLEENEVNYHIGKSWTTDAFFRETEGLVALRRAQNCLVVEMEASLFFAVAEHRGIDFAQMVYGADDLSGEEWDERGWRDVPALRRQMFELALDALTSAE